MSHARVQPIRLVFACVQFQPQSGPSAGGSLLTIHGRYLGGSSSAAAVDGGGSTAGTLTGASDTASVQIGTTNCTIEFRNFSTLVFLLRRA